MFINEICTYCMEVMFVSFYRSFLFSLYKFAHTIPTVRTARITNIQNANPKLVKIPLKTNKHNLQTTREIRYKNNLRTKTRTCQQTIITTENHKVTKIKP